MPRDNDQNEPIVRTRNVPMGFYAVVAMNSSAKNRVQRLKGVKRLLGGRVGAGHTVMPLYIQATIHPTR